MISIRKVFFIFIILITFMSVERWSKISFGNTFFWWGIEFLFIIIILLTKKRINNNIKKEHFKPVLFFLGWMIICIVRGLLVAENYWEWKNLTGTSLVLLMGISVFVFSSLDFNQYLLKNWFRYLIPVFLIFFIFLKPDAYGHFLAPIIILSLFFPLLTKKWKIIVIFLTFFIIVFGQTSRSNVIKFSVAILIGYLAYIFNFFLTKNAFNMLRLIFLISPIVFFGLGISGVFNVFKISEYIEGDYTAQVVKDGEIKEESLTSDTRTFLYIEVISSAINNNYLTFGRTPARGNDSEVFGGFLAKELNTGKNERFSNEVAILNIFTWTGLLGVVLYFYIFFRASYLAINKSNNFFIKVIGLFVCFRWMYAWVEDFSRFDLTNIILWMLISICYSESYRNMNNLEVKNWVMGLITFKSKNFKKF